MSTENTSSTEPVQPIVIWRCHPNGIAHGFEEGHATSKCGLMTEDMGDQIDPRQYYECWTCRARDACRICDGKKNLYDYIEECDVVCWSCKGSGLRLVPAR